MEDFQILCLALDDSLQAHFLRPAQFVHTVVGRCCPHCFLVPIFFEIMQAVVDAINEMKAKRKPALAERRAAAANDEVEFG